MAFLHLVVLSTICSLSMAALVPMDDFSKTSLDTLVRKQLLFQILHRVNNTIKIQIELKTQCEKALNFTIAQCSACAAVNQEQGGSPPDVMTAVIPYLLKPAVATGELLKSAEGSVVTAVSFLGGSSKQFVNDIGSVATNAGNTLIHGAEDIVKDALGGLTDFGDQLAGLANGLGHGLENVGNEIASGTIDFGSGVGHEFEHLGETLASGANSAIHGISDLGHKIEHAGSSVVGALTDFGNGIGDLFGKRSATCPMCDKLDTKTMTPEQIVASVCDASTVAKQHNISLDLGKMRKIYEYAVQHPVVEKVEYDPATMDTTYGVAFRTVFVTYTFGESNRYQSSITVYLTDLPGTADGLAAELYEITAD